MAPRKPALSPLSHLLPRQLRKTWPTYRTPYLFLLSLLFFVTLKLALFTPPAYPPSVPVSAHSSASAALVARDVPALFNASAAFAPDVPDRARQLSAGSSDVQHEEPEEQVEAEVRLEGEQPGVAGPQRPVDDAQAAPPAHQAAAPAPPVQQPGNCMEYIVYDKPVKTGSTAVRDALLSYFAQRGSEFVACTFEECNAAAERILAGAEPPRNLVEHLLGQDGLVERLGEAGYYKVTSIRDPKSRWESAFRYNRAKNARHYGIEADVSYEEFMRRLPPCSLFDFYDHQGGQCGEDLEGRIKKIVYRYHEIIDLYDDKPAGQLHMRLQQYLSVSNKSPETKSDGEFDASRLENETKLYKALKKRRLELHGHEPLLC